MASNNRKPQQRWSYNDASDGEKFPSLAQRAQQRPGGTSQRRAVDIGKVEEKLNEMFLGVFDADIIRSVAQASDWELNSAVEKLLTLASEPQELNTRAANPGSNVLCPQPFVKNKGSKTSGSSKQKTPKDSSPKGETSASSAATMWSSNFNVSSSRNKSVLMNAGRGTIKVTYKARPGVDSSDDDADVVIEEEKEFEVRGHDVPLGVPTAQTMCQFLTPLVPADDQAFKDILSVPGAFVIEGVNVKTLAGAAVGLNDNTKTAARKSKHWPKFEKIKKHINDGVKVMVIMRGCPGSGKTSLARHIIKATYGENYQKYVFSTDEFFSLSGKYIFNPKLLSEAHLWNQQRVMFEARKGTSPIIIDNTNIEAWEMKPYAYIAVECGYILELLEPRTSWKNNPVELERKNIHNVTRRKIEDMLQRFDQTLNANSLLTSYNLKYAPNNKPPQYIKQSCSQKGPSSLSLAKKKSRKKVDTTKAKKKKNQFQENKNSHISQDMINLSTQSVCSENEELRDILNLLKSLPLEASSSGMPDVGNFSGDGSSMITRGLNRESGSDMQHQEPELNSVIMDPGIQPVALPNTNMTSENSGEAAGSGYDVLTDSSEDEEGIRAAGMWDDESCDDDDDDLNFSGCEESDSGNETFGVKKGYALENGTSCKEYVMVLDDGTLLPQYYHTEEEMICSDSMTAKAERSWEYVLSQEELEQMLEQKSREVNSLSPIIRKAEGGEDAPGEKDKALFQALFDDLFKNTDEQCNKTMEVTGLPEVVNQNNLSEKIQTCQTVSERSHLEDFSVPLITFDSDSDSQNEIESFQDVVEKEVHLDENVKINRSEDFTSASSDCYGWSLEKRSENMREKENYDDENIRHMTPENSTSVNPDCYKLDNNSENTVEKVINLDENIKNMKTEESSFSKADNNEQNMEKNKEGSVNKKGSEKSGKNLQELISDSEFGQTLDVFSNRNSFESGASSGDCVDKEKMKDMDNLIEKITLHETSAARLEDTDVISVSGEIFDQKLDLEKLEHKNIENKCKLEDNIEIENDDLLEEWEKGSNWDQEEEKNKKPESDSGASTPKPARQSRLHGGIKPRSEMAISPIVIKEQNRVTDKEIWPIVAEPVKSWEKNSSEDDEKILQPAKASVAQPQRSIFAVPKKNDIESTEEESVVKIPIEGAEKSKIILPSSINNENDFPSAVSGELKEVSHDKNELHGSSGMSCEYEEFVDVMTVDSSQETCVSSSTNSAETNTHHADFILLSNINMGSEVVVSGVKILPAFGRNIVDPDTSIVESCDSRRPGMRTLDKSSMTVDTSGMAGSGSTKEHVEELHRMFPSCSVDVLKELFEKCNKDVNWTVDVLLESGNQGIELTSTSNLSISNFEGNFSGDACESENEIEVDAEIPYELATNNNESIQLPTSLTVPENHIKSISPVRRNGKKDRNAQVSEMSILLKKQLEENIVISDEHYSEHVSRIRKLRHGELPDPTTERASGSGFSEYEMMEIMDSGNSCTWSTLQDPLSIHSLRPEAPEWDLQEMLPDETVDEEEENVQLKMDSTFTEQLHTLFGTASLPFKQDAVPTLNLPTSLARQLHYYLMEAEQNTYDMMMQEDEELARQLQQQENESDTNTEVKPADLREIMEMEMALAMYKADQKQFHDESKDDMATRLKKNLLCEWFPSLPRDVLIDVFEAHDHSFDQTIEVLVASTEEDKCVRTVMSPEARAAYEKALMARARQESEKTKDFDQPYKSEQQDEVTQERAFQDADLYRAEATRYYALRNECQSKAQRAYQRGHPSVAAYYSQMAALHKQKIEENNAKAASSLLLAHSLGNLTTTLDLHFLYVVEALQVLDMFLDHHVHKLASSGQRSKQVFVITGRGARSTGGRSRIKPAVVQRLEQRGLRHSEVNPGLLGVVVTRNSALSTTINT